MKRGINKRRGDRLVAESSVLALFHPLSSKRLSSYHTVRLVRHISLELNVGLWGIFLDRKTPYKTRLGRRTMGLLASGRRGEARRATVDVLCCLTGEYPWFGRRFPL